VDKEVEVLEAGFFPGVLFVLTLWVPWEYRGRLVGMFMGWSAVANAVGAVIGGLLLDADGTLHLRGWQWVFLMTALPAIVMLSIGLFAQELSSLGIRGIWFPYGTGVSRTQYAYAIFDLLMFGLLLRRLAQFAPRRLASVETRERPIT